VEWPREEGNSAEQSQERDDAERINKIYAEDDEDRNKREQKLRQAFHTAMAGIDAAAALVSPVGAHTHIAEIYGLALHGHGDPEMLGIVNQWVAEMDALNRRMHRHWTVPEKASLVALLDRFKAVLHHLHGVIVHSVFVPALRQPIAHQRARIKKLFVGDSQVASDREPQLSF
jgi:hypothetical protein